MVQGIALPEQGSAHHVTRMQQIVLQWDYYKLTSRAKGKEKKKLRELRKVPERFQDIQEYLAVFEPLLLEECCAQLTRGESQDDYAAPPQAAVVLDVERAHDFHLAKVAMEVGKNLEYAENDLVLLSQITPGTKDAKTKLYALASVEGQEGNNSIRVRFFLPDQPRHDPADASSDLHHATADTHARGMRNRLHESNSSWWLKKLCNMSTIMREWLALHTAPTFPFQDLIARPAVRLDHTITRRICPAPLMSHLEATHNSSQVAAIATALQQRPVNLIQGPPGTGKTRTILGLLSVLLQSTAAPPGSAAQAEAEASRAAASAKGLVVFRQPMKEEEKHKHWRTAAPWLTGANMRERPPAEMLSASPEADTWPAPATPVLLSERKDNKLHVLVCAPSNSALDEIVYRIIHSGLSDARGDTYIPSIVRVGVQPHHSIHSVSMESLIRGRMESTERTAAGRGTAGRGKQERDRVRINILDEASIVASTLAFSGSSMFSRMTRNFDVVVIDEAAQAVEPSTMVPLCHGCRQLFLVGDPIQLPATVLSDRAKDHGYDDSLFKRFQTAGYPVNMLTVQYRMHPEIRRFPSLEFYEEGLEDGPDVVQDTVRPWHEHPCFGPFAWLDVRGKESTPEGSGSRINKDEAQAALAVIRDLILKYKELREPGLMAVISPYKEQVRLIQKLLADHLPDDIAHGIDVNTVDGFQGREKLIAIFSGVRSNEKAGIGFVRDQRRMNVGLTRGRSAMLVVGNAKVLRKSASWRRLVRSAKERKCLFRFKPPFKDALARLTASSYSRDSEVYSEEGEDEEWEDDEEDDFLADANFGAVTEAEGEWVPLPEPGNGSDSDEEPATGTVGKDFGEELVSEQRGLVGIEDEDDTGEMAAAGDGGGGGSGAAASRRPSKKRGVDAVKPAARKAAPASKKAKK